MRVGSSLYQNPIHLWQKSFCLQQKSIKSIFGELLDLLQVSLAAKKGEGIKVRETCNTWQPGSLAGQDFVQSASFYKKPISNHMLRKDNDTTE